MNTFDIETIDWTKPFLLGYYDGEDFNYFRGRNCVKKFLNILIEKNGLWYAHYGGGFDFKFILNELLKTDYKIRTLFANGLFYKIMVYKNKTKLFELRDSFCLLPCTLEELTKSFNVRHQKLDLNRNKLSEYALDEQIEYLKNDCIGLHEVLTKFKKILNVDKLKLTVGSQSLFFIKKECPQLEKVKMEWSKESILREAYYGGRIEVFKRYGENLYHYDFNSMYPSIMRNNLFPLGKMAKIDHFEKDYLGVYKVKWSSPNLYVPLLPLRLEKLFFYNGKGEGWYYSPEIKKALEIGYKIKVLEGYIWLKSDNLFKNFIDKYYKIKKHSKGAKREVAKFLLNSGYGKFAQHQVGDKILFDVPTFDEFDKEDITCLDVKNDIYRKKVKIYNKDTAIQISGLISSCARVKLYNVLDEDTYYCDTDCIITSKKLKSSDKLGELKLEHKIREGYFLFPKIYAYITHDGKKVIKAKGFRKIGYKAYVRAFNGNYSDFKEEYEQLVGFLESYSSTVVESFIDKIKRRKQLYTTFDKRKLINKINTIPITI